MLNFILLVIYLSKGVINIYLQLLHLHHVLTIIKLTVNTVKKIEEKTILMQKYLKELQGHM